MFKRKNETQSGMLRALTNEEIEFVVGGAKAGPNGEGCTEPRRPTKGGGTGTKSLIAIY